MVTACDAIVLIDSDEVDQLLNRLTTQELLVLISEDSALNVMETEQGQRWDKEAIERAIESTKERCKNALVSR